MTNNYLTVTEIGEHDILLGTNLLLLVFFVALTCTQKNVNSGRGGFTYQHRGNIMLKNLAREKAEEYRHCSKKEKSQMSRGLVGVVHSLTPPGR